MAIKIELAKDALELEIDTNKIDASHMDAAAALSSAISLKRIADALESMTRVDFDYRMNQLTDAIHLGIMRKG